ncbi:MAG: hypothetical protein HYZ53_21085 [Planctomycetes bacterium]|nr:hypothetical protein [Planctomycetota bacterium]
MSEPGKSREDAILRGVVRMATELPPEAVAEVVAALESLPAGAKVQDAASVVARSGPPGVRDAVARILDDGEAYAPEATAPPRSIAWALRGACAAHQQLRTSEAVELVWTGPTPPGTGFRRTEQALLEMIGEARASILLVTYVAYRVPELVKGLLAAARRGVRLTLVLEDRESSEGRMELDPRIALGDELARVAQVLSWPLERRMKDEHGRRGSLHVKCAVADEQVLLVSSANLTGHAMDLNMELGLLFRGGQQARRVAEHFERLQRDGVLRGVDPR